MARKKPIKPNNKTFNISVGAAFKGGGFTISSPTYQHYNGSNYALYYERYNSANPSRMWIVKQTDNNIETNSINTNTPNPDNLDHTTPIGPFFKNGYIYALQCDGWVQPIRVYKSTNPEDIRSWTYIGSFDTDASYIYTVQGDDVNNMRFVTRSGNAGNNGYDMSLLTVDLDNPSAYTKLRITEADFNTNQVRHYVMASYFYGTSTYRCLIVNHRNESTAITYKQSLILWEYGTNTVRNLDNTFSKDVGLNGGLTTTELETYFKFKGTDSTKGVWNVALSSIQINNDIYLVSSEPTGTFMYKFDIATGLTPTATATLSWWPVFTLYNQGNRFLLSGKSNTGVQRIFKIEYDLTGYSTVKDITGLIVSGNEIGIPFNMADVVGKFLICGNAESGSDGNIRVTLTKETWN